MSKGLDRRNRSGLMYALSPMPSQRFLPTCLSWPIQRESEAKRFVDFSLQGSLCRFCREKFATDAGSVLLFGIWLFELAHNFAP